MTGPVVLAFGGHVIEPGEDPVHPANFTKALTTFGPGEGGMVLVHGNGPQVGMILQRIEATRDRIPPETLDVLVAETQGSMGYLLARSIRNALERTEVAAILTQVVVDPGDAAFRYPTKPVGPVYDDAEAKSLGSRWKMAKTGRGWHRVVPSPRPRAVVEIHTIRDAVSHGHLVIAGGGGGIPVFRDSLGRLVGVEAVVDKDYTASLLATRLGAESFVVITDVPHVSRDLGTPSEEAISRMSVSEAGKLLAEGEFPPGSMGPKVEAAAKYARATGRPALITNLGSLADALEGGAGTWIYGSKAEVGP